MSQSFCLFQSKIPGIWGFLLWESGILPGAVFLVDSSFFSYSRFQMAASQSVVFSFLFGIPSTSIVLMSVSLWVCPTVPNYFVVYKGGFFSFLSGLFLTGRAKWSVRPAINPFSFFRFLFICLSVLLPGNVNL